MKYSIVLFAVLSGFSLASCNSGENNETTNDSTTVMTTTTETAPTTTTTYVDLQSGRPLTKDEASGRYVDESGSPVQFYVDVNAGDTFSGESGMNVNNSITHEGDTWRMNDEKPKLGDDVKIKANDEKVKIKTDDEKTKIIDHDKDGKVKTKTKEK